MQRAGPAQRVKDRALPLVVVAGEFSTGKSSLINLLLRQRVLEPSVGLRVQPPTRLRHSTQRIVNACRRDGAMQRVAKVEHATRTPDLAEIEIYLPFDRFPGVEIQELPAPSSAGYSEAHRHVAASADILLWCTIGSQPWRLSEKDCLSKLGRSPDQTTILCVMRDDLIRTDSDRGKINRRLETEARPFFSEIVFIDASNRTLQASQTDDAAWQKSGAGVVGSAISRLPGASIPPTPEIVAAPDPIPVEEPEAKAGPTLSVVPQPETPPAVEPITASAPEEQLDHLITEALEILLSAVSTLDGCRYAAVVIDAAYTREWGTTTNLTSVAAARALFFAQMRSADDGGPVEEIIIRGRQETHLLSAIDNSAHMHIVLDPSATTLASVRIALRKLKESASAST